MVAFHDNGKLRPRYATVGGKMVEGKMVGGEQVEYPEGHYEVRCYVEGKRVWRNVGEDARTALAEQKLLTRQTTTRMAAASGDTIADAPGRIDLAAKAKVYHARQITRKKHRHALRFKREIAEFLACTGVSYADQLTEEVILRWYDRLQEGGNSDRTLYNKHCMVFGFLKWCGVITKPLATNGPPSIIKKKPKIYSQEELGVFMASLKKQYHRVVYNTFMKTGMREQEVMYLEPDNFDFNTHRLRCGGHGNRYCPHRERLAGGPRNAGGTAAAGGRQGVGMGGFKRRSECCKAAVSHQQHHAAQRRCSRACVER